MIECTHRVEDRGETRIVGQWGLRRNRRFPQGGGPWVSVLIPTRGRPNLLLRAFHSLWAKSRYKDNVEYVFRVDDDDEETKGLLARDDLPARKVIAGPRGGGYRDLHKHLASMADLSGGDWLMNFNDDAVMLTEGWDQVFDGRMAITDDVDGWFGCPDGIFALVPFVEGRPYDQEFFAVHRRVFEALGHFGTTARVDDWVTSVFGVIGRRCRCRIYIGHEHGDENDRTLQEGRGSLNGYAAHLLMGEASAYYDRLADAMKLLDRIKEFGKMEDDDQAKGVSDGD